MLGMGWDRKTHIKLGSGLRLELRLWLDLYLVRVYFCLLVGYCGGYWHMCKNTEPTLLLTFIIYLFKNKPLCIESVRS